MPDLKGELRAGEARSPDSRTGMPAGANLGFVYVTQEAGDELEAIVRNLKIETGIENWVGAAGIGICATGTEYFREPAVAVMAGAMLAWWREGR